MASAKPHHERSVWAVGGEQFFKTHPSQFKAACSSITAGTYEQSERLAEEAGEPEEAAEASTVYPIRHCMWVEGLASGLESVPEGRSAYPAEGNGAGKGQALRKA